jgi:DNA-binding GntR family transcriptional regulator
MTASPPSPATGNQPLSLLASRLAVMLGSHEPGWRLPRASEIARRFGVNAEEMEAAVAELASRHLVRQLRDGRLYLASPAEYLTTFEPLPGLGSVIDPMGATIKCTEHSVTEKPVPEDARRALRLATGVEATTVQRIWTAHRCPAAISTTYLPAWPPSLLFPGQGSLPAEIGAILNPPSAYPVQGTEPARPGALYLEVQPPPYAVGRRLRLRPGEPAITVTVLVEHPAAVLPFALTVAVLRADLFRIALETTPAQPAAGPADKKAWLRTMALPSFLAKIVSWLRAGYPDGVPKHDYIPLIALLGRQLTDDEVTLVAGELAFSSDPESAQEIRKAASAITRTTVSDSDIARVRSRLAAGGWPLAAPDRD